MIKQTDASGFLKLAGFFPVVDVRSEKEFMQGHIPGAINLPLFNNEERELVGILYKNSGRDTSILKGLELAGPKLAGFIKQLHKIADHKELLVHCWRGGLRSESMAWLFDIAGYDVTVLEGGYKTYRRFIREEFSGKANIIVLGGLTGSGKTSILHQLKNKGEQVLDLEYLACHKGSVFGGFQQPVQPTNEQFENDIYAIWEKLDPAKRVWIEDESRMIGNVSIPDPLFDQLGRAKMIKVETTKEKRIDRLVEEYSKLDKQDLKNAVLKIRDNIGGANAEQALEAIDNSEFAVVADLTLLYYDKAYLNSLKKREIQSIHPITVNFDNPESDVEHILKLADLLEEK